MSKEKVKLILVVDASSSMITTMQETIGAVEKIIKEHKQLTDKKVRLQIYAFDTKVTELIPTMKIKDYTNEFSLNYTPTGMTALHDGIGRAVTENKNNTEFVKTSLIILTDGYENASQEFDKKQVAALLSEVQDKLDWDVSYIGAKMANFSEHTASLGIKFDKSIAIDPNLLGARSTGLNSASTMSLAYMTTKG